MVHLVPFQRSATGLKSPSPFLRYPPTAVQVECDEQSTPLRKTNCVPGGLGVGWLRHLCPFHRSASVPAFENPTAVHDLDEVQATPSRPAPPCDGLGVRWMRHLWPFHRSARVPRSLWPTAVQAEGAVHETSSR